MALVLVGVLIVLNVPVFLFLGWVAFDSKEGAARTFGETIVALLQILLIPRIVREVMGMDDEGAIGLLPIIGFFIACAAIVAGEYWLIAKYFPGLVGQ